MYTGIILMCAANMVCYPIVSENGFFESYQDCQASIQSLINSEQFDPAYRLFEEGVTYSVASSKCINWKDDEI